MHTLWLTVPVYPGGSNSLLSNFTYYATSEDVLMGIDTVAVNGLPCQAITSTDARPTDSIAVQQG